MLAQEPGVRYGSTSCGTSAILSARFEMRANPFCAIPSYQSVAAGLNTSTLGLVFEIDSMVVCRRAACAMCTAACASNIDILPFVVQKRKPDRLDYWLAKGIVVKVVTSKLGEQYYKKKGVVTEVMDRYGAKVRMLDSGDKLRLDQVHLETVIPALGRTVRVLNGRHRGEDATLETLDEASFSCSVKLTTGPSKGLTVNGVAYEDISKLHSGD
jgi:KN17 SH3-like C-terminal domain